MEWISLDKQGEYKITEVGGKNPLDNLILTPKKIYNSKAKLSVNYRIYF